MRRRKQREKGKQQENILPTTANQIFRPIYTLTYALLKKNFYRNQQKMSGANGTLCTFYANDIMITRLFKVAMKIFTSDRSCQQPNFHEKLSIIIIMI